MRHLATAIALTALLAGCEDETCEDGEKVCSDGRSAVLVCEDGAWSIDEDCTTSTTYAQQGVDCSCMVRYHGAECGCDFWESDED